MLLRHVTEDQARQMVEQMTQAIERMSVTFKRDHAQNSPRAPASAILTRRPETSTASCALPMTVSMRPRRPGETRSARAAA